MVWSLRTMAPICTSSTRRFVVRAGGYAVLGRSMDAATNGGAPVDYAYGEDLTLGNGADALELGFGKLRFDRVAWDNGLTFPDPNGEGQQIGRAHV